MVVAYILCTKKASVLSTALNIEQSICILVLIYYVANYVNSKLHECPYKLTTIVHNVQIQ